MWEEQGTNFPAIKFSSTKRAFDWAILSRLLRLGFFFSARYQCRLAVLYVFAQRVWTPPPLSPSSLQCSLMSGNEPWQQQQKKGGKNQNHQTNKKIQNLFLWHLVLSQELMQGGRSSCSETALLLSIGNKIMKKGRKIMVWQGNFSLCQFFKLNSEERHFARTTQNNSRPKHLTRNLLLTINRHREKSLGRACLQLTFTALSS